MLPPPVLDGVTLDAAEHLIATLHLGHNPGVTDLLLVSLSGTDRVGHYFGTRGPEMCDHLQRLDRRLGAFLNVIEATKLPVLIALSADHGAADFPERLHEEGYDASRFDGKAWLAEVNRHLAAAETAGIHLTSAIPEVLSRLMLVDAAGRPLTGAARAAAMPAALATVRAAPRVREAYSLDELASIAPQALHTSPPLLSVAQRLALSANPQHASDILVAFEPLQYSIDAAPGILLETHGSPYDYDRRVPMLFWWPGVEHSERLLPVATVDLAPTLAAVMNVPPPPGVNGHCLEIRAFARATCPGN
jgi:predicted AlkP superfamily pyrophosphatase or phosphodiesterase